MAHYLPIKFLDTLAGGALAEKFAVELASVLANIRDPNTKATAKREITLKIGFTPSPNRDSSLVSIKADSKLTPAEPIEITAYLDYDDNGMVTATEKTDQIPGQISMEGEETPLPKVVQFETKKN